MKAVVTFEVEAKDDDSAIENGRAEVSGIDSDADVEIVEELQPTGEPEDLPGDRGDR